MNILNGGLFSSSVLEPTYHKCGYTLAKRDVQDTAGSRRGEVPPLILGGKEVREASS